MFIQKLAIENWKNFQSGEVTLGHRLFLVGPNASGKSNFLDIFRFLRDLCLPKGGGFLHAVEVRGGVSAIRCLASRKHSDIVIDAELNNKSSDEIWDYRLGFKQEQGKPIITEEKIQLGNRVLLDRPDENDREDPLRLTQTALEQITTNKDFRPVYTFFQSVSYQHLLPQVIRDPQGFSPDPVRDDPFGRDFLQRVENTPARWRAGRLKKILKVLKIAAPQLKELQVERDKWGVPHLVGLFEHWRPKAGKQNESQFSDGTLRLFGLLWALFEGDGPVLMEEPELSLHAEIVKRLPQMIERINRSRKLKRQVIISTHSEDMLRDEGIGGGETLRLEPSKEGTVFKSPLEDEQDRRLLENGLSVADVVLPKSSPENTDQLSLPF